MTDKHYDITIYNGKEDKIVRNTTVYSDEIESIGGIGNYIESIDSIIKENEQIRITPYWI